MKTGINNQTQAPIKVAHVATIATSLRLLLIHQIKSLQKEGYKLYALSAVDSGVQSLEEAGVVHFPIEMTRTITPFRDLVTIFKFKKIFKREQFHIVHTHTPKATLIAQISARLAKTPVVINTLHGYYFHENTKPLARKILIAMEKFSARYAHVILSQNQEDVDTAINEKICGPDKIKYLGNGINIDNFQPESLDQSQVRQELGIASDAMVIGFVGRLAAVRKGFRDFLKAIQIIVQSHPNAVFLIVGESDIGRPDAVDPKEAADYGIEKNCMFVGFQPNDQLPKYHKAMDMLVLPSFFEGIPRVIMEAMAMGNPVVATNVRGNREAVFHDDNGFLVEFGDYEDLAKRIMQLMEDEQLRVQMGQRARQLAEEKFDEQRVFARVKEEYALQLKSKNIIA